tara:strand:- start:222 stop:620 length:399 start_codon:yes stop_codon:yes gene_type:complete
MTDLSKPLDSVHVYLLDDDEAVCDSLAAVLEMHGARIETFLSVNEMRAAQLENRDGVLIFDIQLQDGLGHELLAELRDRGITMPAILMSGNLEKGRLQSLSGLCEILLEKPVDGDDLALRIAAVLKPGNRSR